MANDNLRHALDSADLQPDHLAELIGVDIRTVRRWLSGRPPYPRHRTKIARALQIPEQALWPDLPPPTHPQARDLINGYPDPDTIGIPSTESLIQAAGEQIDLLDHTLADYLQPAAMTELLLAKARDGVQVRIMVSEPGQHLTPLVGQQGIELRAVDPDDHHILHRYDNAMLLTLPLPGELDEPPALLHIQRRGPDGLFDRYAAYYQDTWENGSDPLATEADIEDYLHDDFDEDEPQVEQDIDTNAGDTAAAIHEAPAPVARHWPRRPS